MKKESRQSRLNSILEHLRNIGRVHTRKDFAEAIGARPESISSALNGKDRYLTDNLFKKIALEFGDVFNREWIETGEGPMLRDHQSMEGNSGTVIGNNIKVGRGPITISPNVEGEALNLLREQLAVKDAEISRLHGIIEKLLER